MGIGLNAFAMELSGTLTKATWEYITVDRDKYPVTDKTTILDKDSLEEFFTYDPEFLMEFLRTDNQSITVIIEDGEVENILISVPK